MGDVELLAPAGSYESMTAAFAAGADAVYLGGAKFGARAFANNLDEEELKRAIDFAHIHNRQLYLTVNTLLKDSELHTLYDYLNPYYREGLDAVIVQDFGVLKYIKEQFPGIAIHASTQMTSTGSLSAAMLKEYGATRVVTAREMNLSEIKEIHDHVDIEIESFVHGALCFCYSGQCLLSSMLGGRSGNRGRCAQPCRLPYTLLEKEKSVSSQKAPYLMSPKDMCTIDLIPELVESGIYSFKMEGRMKKPVYTAGITSIYRKYLDLYLEKGKEGFQVSQEDFNILADLYNRGGFSQGYYRQHNGKDMMTLARPNHMGTPAAKVISVSGSVTCQSLEELHAKDILEVPGKKEHVDLTLKDRIGKHKTFTVKPNRDAILKKDMILYRTRNQSLIDDLENLYVKQDPKRKIKGILILSPGKSATLTLQAGKVSVTVTGEEVSVAMKRPVTEEDAKRQLMKTGQTNMAFEKLDIFMDGAVFLPMQALNDLRRRAILQLEEALIEKKRRGAAVRITPDSFTEIGEKEMRLRVSVDTLDQLLAVSRAESIDRIYVSSTLFTDKTHLYEECKKVIDLCHKEGKECFLITPWIHRKENRTNLFFDLHTLRAFDGLLVKSLETFAFLKNAGYDKSIGADTNLYTFNQTARAFLREEGMMFDTAPLEMNYQELKVRGCENSEIVIYGYTPLMISSQCFRKNTTGCDKTSTLYDLKDRKGVLFPVRNFCSSCVNIIYNSAPTELIDQMKEICTLNPCAVRLSFTIESKEETEHIMNVYEKGILGHVTVKPVHETFTRGHFKRGVD